MRWNTVRPATDERWRQSIVTRSPLMLRLLEQAGMVAQSDVSVLINGQSGTGKRSVAQAIHNASPRSENAFIAINCGALPEQLLESELFGHARGAFTRRGRAAGKGCSEPRKVARCSSTEIGDMPAPLQVKLLRGASRSVKCARWAATAILISMYVHYSATPPRLCQR